LHMEELAKYSSRNIKKRHQDQFVRWFEGKIKHLYNKGEVSEHMFALSRGPDHRTRTMSRCHINNWLFRTSEVEKNLVTQNSGVLVRGDATTGNMNWYGVIRKIISLEFAGEKEVILFKCDWYDVPAISTSRSIGYKRDQWGIIDINTSRFRFLNEPYILATQAEPVFYVKLVTRREWSSVVLMKPRNLFSMPEEENEAEIDIDSIDMGIQGMNLVGAEDQLSNWTRSGMQGTTGDASVIQQVHAQAVEEPDDDLDGDDDDEDDTYINDGVVAPAASAVQGQEDDDFFV
ncbi:unnamed protein product, partial [Urochloa humidicola]